jgi:beta-glucosidase
MLGVAAVAIGFSLYRHWYMPLPTGSTPECDGRYRSADLSVDERVEALLGCMTLDEKIGQMALVEKNSIHWKPDITRYGIGALLSGGGGKPDENTPSGWRDMVEDFQAYARRSRLGIPLLYGVDAVHGNTNVLGATVFPHNIGDSSAGNERTNRQADPRRVATRRPAHRQPCLAVRCGP